MPVLQAKTQPGLLLSQWDGVDPTGLLDSSAAVQAAIYAVAGTRVQLIWDARIYCQMGMSWLNSIFIPSNVEIAFIGAGVCVTDGIGVPTFILENPHDVTIRNIKIEYTGTFGVSAISYTGNQIASTSTLVGGSGYVDGVYSFVPLTGGAGSSAYATVTVVSGAVTACTIVFPGTQYAVGNTLSASNTKLGGSGSGFSVTVATLLASTPFATAVNSNCTVTRTNYLAANYVPGVSGNSFQSHGILTLNTLVAGSGYANGTYTDVPLTGGTGVAAKGNFTVAGGVVTACAVGNYPGSAYTVGDSLSASAVNLGGSGSGFTIAVATVSGSSSALFQSPTNGSALIQLLGDCQRVRFFGGRLYVPQNALPSAFIPQAVAFGAEWMPGTVVTGATPQNNITQTYPLGCELDDIELDGCYMGFCGGAYGVRLSRIHSKRYSDMQNSLANDPQGLQVGGVGTWFAPPHLFYLNAAGSFPQSYYMENVLDEGLYTGIVTRRTTASGYMHSLKIPMGNGTNVNGYVCRRPDGFGQILSTDTPGGSITNVYCEHYSTINMAVNAGATASAGQSLVFPSSPLLQSILRGITLVDLAPIPAGFTLGSDSSTAHSDMEWDIRCIVQDWPATAYVGTSLSGNANTSTYPTGFPGFGCGGSNNDITVKVIFNACTSTTASRGVLANQGGAAPVSSSFNIRVIGWRLINSNIDALKMRIQLSSSVPTLNLGNYAEVRDVTNNWTATIEDACEVETWCQGVQITPAAGATYDTGILFPSSFAIDQVAVANGPTPPAGPTSMNLGDSGSATRFATGLSATVNSNTFIPAFSPIPLVSNPTHVILTAVGGNFTGTGVMAVSMRGRRMSISG